MGDLSKNFSRFEFVCQGTNCCGHSAPVSPELVAGLQKLRDLVGQPLTVLSGFRCNAHNAEVGGVENSRHTTGEAADIMAPEGLTVSEFHHFAEQVETFGNGGIGVYNNRLHVDTRPGRARWCGR